MSSVSTNTTIPRSPLDRLPVMPGPFVIDNAHSDTSIIDELYQWFLSTPNTGNFGGFLAQDLSIEHQRVLNWTGGNKNFNEPQLLDWARVLVSMVRDTDGAREIKAADSRSILGYEFWGNVASSLGKTGYHIDRDENMDWERCILERLFPVVSTVTYIGPSKSLCGGELLIDMGDDAVSFHVKAMRSGMPEKEIIAARDSWVRIPYRYNRVAVFPGDRPHLVTELKDEGALRCSVGIGLWHRIIQ